MLNVRQHNDSFKSSADSFKRMLDSAGSRSYWWVLTQPLVHPPQYLGVELWVRCAPRQLELQLRRDTVHFPLHNASAAI